MVYFVFAHKRSPILLVEVAFDDVSDDASGATFRDERHGNAQQGHGFKQTVDKAATGEVAAIALRKVMSGLLRIQARLELARGVSAQLVGVEDGLTNRYQSVIDMRRLQKLDRDSMYGGEARCDWGAEDRAHGNKLDRGNGDVLAAREDAVNYGAGCLE